MTRDSHEFENFRSPFVLAAVVATRPVVHAERDLVVVKQLAKIDIQS